MALSVETLAMAKTYTNETVDGLGALKGAPCTVESIQNIPGGKRITLGWEGESGQKQTQSFDVMDGKDGANVVEWLQIQQDGTKIAEININGVPTEVYAPAGGGTGDVADVEVNGVSVLDPSDKIAKITSYKEVTESEYEAIPVAERESNGIAYFIKDLNNSSVQGYPPLIYSDEEREVGVWRDGKPLYEKTKVFSGVSSTNGSISFDVTDIGIVFLANFGELYEGCTMPYIHGENQGLTVGGFFDNKSTGLTWEFRSGGQAEAPLYGFMTIRYTKTTDTPGSGIWNGQGGIAHHYSLQETIVGTWHNGKPLYEKTIIFDTGVTPSNIGVDITSYMPANCEVVNSSFVITYSYEGVDYRNVNTNGQYGTEGNTHYFYFSIGGAQYNKHVELTIQYIKITN